MSASDGKTGGCKQSGKHFKQYKCNKYFKMRLVNLRHTLTSLQMVFLSDLSIVDQAVGALLSILSAKEAPVGQSHMSEIENTLVPSPAARILAEIKTR